LAVIVFHGEVERIDPPEIFGIENMLGADTPSRRRTQIGLKDGQDWFENRYAGNSQRGTAIINHRRKPLIDDCIEDDARLGIYAIQHPLHLLFRTDQWINMLYRSCMRILRRSSASSRDESLAGRIRNHVKMKVIYWFRHRNFALLLMAGDNQPKHPQLMAAM
jgi:hypothetical protein